jgi:deoxycytidine triphosphate deaminase
MSTSQGDTKASALREAERQRLSSLPVFPLERPAEENGVLLSNRIKQYSELYKLIDPFDEKLLRPAGYDLTVGRNYSRCGERNALNDGMKLEIEPYQVAIIETYETINMPPFLVGRWNIRVARAYEGLLWVGGAQVDPGFRGHLCCPIYNLSTEKVTLGFRETVAMIDFVTTTPYEEGKCKKFLWQDRRMLLFSDYRLLSSGIEAEVQKFEQTIKEHKDETRTELTTAVRITDESFRTLQTRSDNFVSLIFTVVAVLFAGLGIIATKAPDQPSFLNSPVWVAAVALYFALRANTSRPREQSLGAKRDRLTQAVVALMITGTMVAASFFFSTYSAHSSALEVQRAKDQAAQATISLEKGRRSLEASMEHLRQHSEASLENLQQQINLLQRNQSKTK